MNDDVEPLLLAEELSEVTMPMLSVSVDFNDLLDSVDEAKAFELIGKLKDLLS